VFKGFGGDDDSLDGVPTPASGPSPIMMNESLPDNPESSSGQGADLKCLANPDRTFGR
jgi:hypothetical protein